MRMILAWDSEKRRPAIVSDGNAIVPLNDARGFTGDRCFGTVIPARRATSKRRNMAKCEPTALMSLWLALAPICKQIASYARVSAFSVAAPV